MSKTKFEIRGFVKAVVTRADGTSYVHLDEENTIHADYKAAICDALMGANDIALDNVFNGAAPTPPPAGEDGIAFYANAGAIWYEMDCLTTPPAQSGYDVVVVGTFTGVGLTIIANVAHVALGHDYDGTPFADMIANPGTWNQLVLGAADTLTITWTIKHASS